MLYHFLYEFIFPMGVYWAPLDIFRVVQYVTFRTAASTLTSLLLGLFLGPWLIRRLREFQVGQHIREEGPQSHQSKAGTPTMGGVLIVVSIVLPTLLWANLRNPFVWLLIFSTVSFAGVGFADDYMKMRYKRNLGLTGKEKFALQFLVSVAVAGVLLYLAHLRAYSTTLTVPFFKFLQPDLVVDDWLSGPFAILGLLPFLIFVGVLLVGTSNAVNLTDGLDGLAIGCTLIASTAFTALTYISGHKTLSEYLDIQFIAGVSEVTIFAGPWWEPAWRSSGTTRIPLKCSWATWDLSRLVGLLGQSPW
jgi:phospho-N-acetylmuramoyl-pentapeptide-transferase